MSGQAMPRNHEKLKIKGPKTLGFGALYLGNYTFPSSFFFFLPVLLGPTTISSFSLS